MLRGYSFYLFLFLIPVPFVFFYPHSVIIYLSFLSVFILLFAKRILPFFVTFLSLIILSSWFQFHQYNLMNSFTGNGVKTKGVVLKQSVHRFNTDLFVLIPCLKDFRERKFYFLKVVKVRVHNVNGDLTGKIVSVKGTLEKEKVYLNKNSNDFFFKLSRGLFYVKVKDRRFVRNIRDVKLFSYKRSLLSDFRNERVRSFLSAIIFGDREALDYRLKDRGKRLGIYHLFVVSGFHQGIFFGALMLFFLPFPLRKRVKSLLAIFILSLMIASTGFSSPALRVYLMILFYYVFNLRGINIPPEDAIGLSGISFLIFSPFSVFGAGFLMSYIASGAIVYGVKNCSRFVSYLLVPFVAFFSILPFYLFVFNYVPFFSPLNNIFLLPFVFLLFFLFFANIVFFKFFTPFLERYVLFFLGVLNHLPSFSLNIYPRRFFLLLFVLVLLLFFVYKKQFFLFSGGLLVFFLAGFFPVKKVNSLCFYDSGKPQCFSAIEAGRCIVCNTGDFYFASSLLQKELGICGVKSIDCLLLASLNDRILDRVEVLCEKVKVKEIIVSRRFMHSVFFYRLEWIKRFYHLRGIRFLANGETFNGGKFRILNTGHGFVVEVGGLRIGVSPVNCINRVDFMLCNSLKGCDRSDVPGIRIVPKCRSKDKEKIICTERGEVCFCLKK